MIVICSQTAKKMFWGIMSACLVFIVSACDDTKKMPISAELIEKIEMDLHVTKVSQPFSRDDYPNVYQSWGDEWMDNINIMLPLAAMRINSQPDCDKVRSLHLSPASIQDIKPILAVTCDNNERFMVSLKDLKNEKRILPLSMLFGKTPSEIANHCFDVIADDFIYPATMTVIDEDSHYLDSSTMNNLELIMPFNIQTGFHSMTKHTVRCRINDRFVATVNFL